MPQQTEVNTQQNIEEAVRWTEDQQRVIDARDRSLLVSAAAGSGKTAVLVERILSMVTDPEHPMDIDEILVVTFTNAAASEMRERIRAALSAAAEENPEDIHLQLQMTLVHGAQINTVDSFCLDVVRNHFHRISLEPGFRIADETESQLIKEDVCDALLEDYYAEGDPDFLAFADGYSDAKTDQNIRDMILNLYKYSQSYPWPEEWLDECAEQYDTEDFSGLNDKPWVRDHLDYLHVRAEEMTARYSRLIEIAQQPDGPEAYVEQLQSELAMLETLTDCDSLESWRDILSNVSFSSLNKERSKDIDVDKRESVKNGRDRIKKYIADLKKEFAPEPEEIVDTLEKTGRIVSTLVDLTKDFSERFALEKAKKNILDFQDVEHFALRILVDPDTKEPTETAAEYRRKFREVMVDEYQDSNYLQEAILTAVSGIPEGRQNMFMVGDVKQSIYRFRQACPDLFIDKYDSFTRAESPMQMIDLHKNFRSRPGVISAVNDVFARIMGRDIGNVEYDEDAALYQGREIGGETDDAFRTECILIEDESDEDRKQVEAGVVAHRIRRMVEDQEIPGIRYRDIVILLRSMKGWAQPFVKAFEQAGVPLLVSSQTGYFSAQEVRVVLSMLRVLDNFNQDIPLAALMRSPIGGFTDTELAMIRADDPNTPFYERVRMMAESSCASDAILNEKLSRFWCLIEDFRSRVPYTPIHELIQQIYDETGYRDLAAAMPAGKQRRANLDMLLKKAVDYEKTSYCGLYHFVRYVDRLIKYDLDIGEAETSSEQENTVRLTSIHQSKGLEYPVVFVSGLGKGFNTDNQKGNMILHPKYGAGLKWCDPVRRTKKDTFIRNVFRIETKKEDMGEELRILYVAMTRAQDKLILTGMAPGKASYTSANLEPWQKLDFTTRIDASTSLGWIIPALESYGDRYSIETVRPEEEEIEDVEHLARNTVRRQTLLDEIARDDPDTVNQLNLVDESFSWEYSYGQSGLKQKYSVSEIKHRAMEEAGEILEEDGGKNFFGEKIPDPYIPKFIEEPEENIGAVRGTAYHRLMECLDFDSVPEEPEPWLQEEIGRLTETGRLEREDAERIDIKQASDFLKTDLARRMKTADESGMLVREQPFVMSVSADQLPADLAPAASEPGESVLIQGIIDAYWEEEDGLVLLDYKTDRIDDEETLVRLYRAQIELYADALGRRFAGKRVKETMIYSFEMDKAIKL